MNLELIKISSHRDGVCGTPFYVILFKDHDPALSDMTSNLMVATYFAANTVAVLNVVEMLKENVMFAEGNSWQGDGYADTLKEFVDAYERRRTEELKKLNRSDIVLEA